MEPLSVLSLLVFVIGSMTSVGLVILMPLAGELGKRAKAAATETPDSAELEIAG
jgi:hypothetical protein